LSWTNPADVSGIAGVFAKFGLEKPVSNDEGDFYIAVDSVVYSTVALINGQNAVWLWLEDNVGNADPSTAVQIVLRYDDIAPISSASAPAISSSSVIPINFNSSDEGAPDTGSGPDFTALRYKHESDLNYSSSAYVLSGSSGTFDFSVERTGVSVEGEWKFYTQAWDKAGNSELQPVSTTIAKASTFLDTTAPVISNVRSTVLSPYSARIDWTTDDETTGIIQYDTRSPIRDTGYKIEDSALVKTHSMTLYGLPSPATIYFKMTASNRSGLQTASVIGSFSTPIKGKKRGR